MDHQRVRERTYLAPSRISGVVWLLLAAAAVATNVHGLSRGLVVVGPYANVNPADVVSLLGSATAFLTAAAVVIGAGRWPAGRRLLLWGAAALALHALLELGIDAWIAWARTTPERFSTAPQIVLAGRALMTAGLHAAGWLLLAGGLWMGLGRRPLPAPRGADSVGITVALLGAALCAAGIVTSDRLVGPAALELGVPLHLAYILNALSWLGMALLSAVALRRLPARDRVPELLIGTGASVAMLVAAYQQLVPLVASPQGVPFDMTGWIFTFPHAMGVLGAVAVAVGFAIARIAPRREVVSPQPTPRPA
jgi:hypothetical protein